MSKRLHVIAVGLTIMLSGCAAFNAEPDNPYDGRRAHYSGVNQMTDSAAIEDVSLVSLLDPDGEARRTYNLRESSSTEKDPWKNLKEGEKIDQAIHAFYSSHYASVSPKDRRNQVQEKLLAASTQRCNIYKKMLQQRQADTNFLTGLGTTIAGGLGAIVHDGGSSRALAGIAGILSGTRAEFNQSYFSNLAVSVIVNGIDLRRKEAYDQIVSDGQAKSISAYPVEAAIKDAFYFHGECSVMAGLEQAQESIKTTADPGIDTMNRVLLKANLSRNILDKKLTDKEALGAMTDIKAGTIIAGTLLKDTQSDNEQLAPVEAYTNANDRIDLLKSKVIALIDSVDAKNLDDNGKTGAKGKGLEGFVGDAHTGLSACKSIATKASKDISAAAIEVSGISKNDAEGLKKANVQYQAVQTNARSVIDKIKLISSEIERGFSDYEHNILEVKNVAPPPKTPATEIPQPKSFDSVKALATTPICN